MNLTIRELLSARHEGLFTPEEAREMYNRYKLNGIQ